MASSEFERVLDRGFGLLRFPAALEDRYLQDKAAERLRMIRLSLALVVVLFNGMLVSDWLMIPDQFRTAVLLRVGVFTPITVLWLLGLRYVSSRSREWFRICMSAGSTAITVYLCVNSTDPLAAPYLVSLSLVLLFNGGVIRVRFWPAVCVALMVFGFFAFAVLNVKNPPVAILSAMGIALTATAVFTLYGSYWLEHEDRSNWLMAQHEHLLMSELDRANQQLDRISRFDSLTDLANRRHFDEFLSQVWGRAEQDGEELALLMIDIDHFKAYNDRYGHPAGDACLKQVANALTSCLRVPGDLVARFGGEEFVAVLTKTSLPMALAAAERVRDGVASLRVPHAASPTSGHVTVSIGVASMKACAQASPAQLIAAADGALYQAKASGRNRACHATPSAQDAEMSPGTTSPPDPQLSAGERNERGQVAEASGLIAQRFSWMRFPAALEQQFLHDGAAARLRHTLISGVLSLFVFNGFLLADYLMAPDVFWLGVKVRLGVFTPAAALVLAIPWLARDWVLRNIPPRAIESIVLVSGVCAAVSLIVILAATRSPTGQYYHVGLMVVVVYGNIVQRLRFWYAVVFSLMVYALHIGGIAAVPVFEPRVVVPMVLLMGATVAFTLMANYALERDERKRYLLSLRRKYLLRDLGDVYQRLQTLSRIDALTGLYNRRHFEEYLQQIWQRAQHDGDEVSIIMLDVDQFKAYNDRYGHPAGDRCLTHVADAMAASLRRPGDLVARFGGEEFIAVLPQTGAAVAQQAAERIRQAVEDLQIKHGGSPTAAVVTASLGVANGVARPGQAVDDLVAAADAALYRAKHSGRNCCAAAAPLE